MEGKARHFHRRLSKFPTVTTAAELAEDAYCEARARCYVGARRVREVCDNEVELWLKRERAAVRAELETQFASLFDCGRALADATDRAEQAVRTLEAFAGGELGHAGDVATLVGKASAVVQVWRNCASHELHGECLLYEAMLELDDAVKAFRESTGANSSCKPDHP